MSEMLIPTTKGTITMVYGRQLITPSIKFYNAKLARAMNFEGS